MSMKIYSFKSYERESFNGPQLKHDYCGENKLIHTINVCVNGTEETLLNSYFVTERISPEEEASRRGPANKYIEAIYSREIPNDIINIMKAFIRYLNKKYSKVTFVISASTLSDKPLLRILFESKEFKKDFIDTTFYDGELIIKPVSKPEINPVPAEIPAPESKKRRIQTSDDESDNEQMKKKKTITDNNGNKKQLLNMDDGNKENIHVNDQTNSSLKSHSNLATKKPLSSQSTKTLSSKDNSNIVTTSIGSSSVLLLPNAIAPVNTSQDDEDPDDDTALKV